MRFVKLGAIAIVLLTLLGCTASSNPLTTAAPTTTAVPSTTSPSTTSTSTSAPPTTSTTTTTAAPLDVSTQAFSIPVGTDGVTYDVDGSPPSGPSSFAVLDDGSVVIADTMAVARGEPRLLRYDRLGELQASIDLADEEVASIVDVATDGSNLAILDVFIAMNRYRVLTMNRAGEVTSTVEIPPGFRFEDGLTGLVWDDGGILLEFRLGERYARIDETGAIESPSVPVLNGVGIEVTPGSDQTTEVVTGSSAFTIERTSEFDGVFLIGIGPDGSIVVVLDEVDMSGPVIEVTRRVQRYSATGQLESEYEIDAGDRLLEIFRPFELDATGNVVYLQALPDRVALVVIGR